MKAAGHVWVVTGAGSGMGRELALLLLRRGARVAAVDRSTTGLETLTRDAAAGEALSTHVADITDRAAVELLPDAVRARHGTVDGLVNNAGIIQPFVPVAELDEATVRRVLEVNFMGTVNMVAAFLPVLSTRPRAHIANVASMGGFFPFPGQSVYGASKAAVRLLTEGLYAELLDTNVTVSVIFPGAVKTDITTNSGVAAAGDAAAAEDSRLPLTSAADAAEIMLAGIERDKLHIYVGKDAKLMSLAIKVAPRPAIRFVQRQMRKLHTPA